MSDSKYSGLIFTAVLVATLFISAAKAKGADFGQANVFNEFYFTFSGDNEGNAVISATPRSNDSRLNVVKVAEDLYVVREVTSNPSVTVPGGGPFVIIPTGPTVTIPNRQTISLNNDRPFRVVRFLVDRSVDLRVEQVNLRVTFPRPPRRGGGGGH